jgi:hypothetical protein
VCYDPTIPLTMTWWKDEGWNKQTSTPTDWQTGDPDNPDPHIKQPQEWTTNGQPEKWLDRWGELINPATGIPYWDEKHKMPPVTGDDHLHGSKGEHDHQYKGPDAEHGHPDGKHLHPFEDTDGKHYHDMYLPRKMYRIQPGDRVLVAWVGDDACVVDIIMQATEMM